MFDPLFDSLFDSVTVIVAVALILLSAFDVTVTVAVPLPFATTFPFESTVATELFEDEYVTSLFVALLGWTVADNVILSPTFKLAELGVNAIPVTSMWLGGVGVFSLTVTVNEACGNGSTSALAVIVVVPTPFATIFPFESTVATESFEENQITPFDQALSGLTVALTFVLSPTFKLAEYVLNSTDWGSTSTFSSGWILTE